MQQLAADALAAVLLPLLASPEANMSARQSELAADAASLLTALNMWQLTARLMQAAAAAGCGDSSDGSASNFSGSVCGLGANAANFKQLCTDLAALEAPLAAGTGGKTNGASDDITPSQTAVVAVVEQLPQSAAVQLLCQLLAAATAESPSQSTAEN